MASLRACMSEKADQLLRLIESPDRFDIPYAEVAKSQIDAANERFQERIGSIGLLGHRAEEAGLTGVGDLADLVPLLFAHTTYKSYPESWLVQNRWDRLGRWLE